MSTGTVDWGSGAGVGWASDWEPRADLLLATQEQPQEQARRRPGLPTQGELRC